MKSKKTRKEQRVLEKFNLEGVDYCVLRNYKNISENDDIDILVANKDGLKVKRILDNFGYTRRIWGFGPKIICDKKWDIKIGGVSYFGGEMDLAKNLLKRKRKCKYFYVLSEEDELKHLILKSIGNNLKKRDYLERIEKLFSRVNDSRIKDELKTTYGYLGLKSLNLIKAKKYSELRTICKKMRSKKSSFSNLMRYFFCRITFPCFKR